VGDGLVLADLLAEGPAPARVLQRLRRGDRVGIRVRKSLDGQRFLVLAGRRWYKTGDLVVRDDNDDYVYLGRRDRMVKKRGYRVELQEIEARLSQHAEVREVAVVALPHEELGVLVRAHLGYGGGKRISIIQLKQFCADHLPVYMVPDQFAFHAALPRTSTGKLDYQALLGSQ